MIKINVILNNISWKKYLKNPNSFIDKKILLINKKKISGILQEILSESGKKFIIIGIGVNLVKSPNIKNYKTTNLFDLTNVKISTNNSVLKLKKIYEKFIPMFPKFNVKNIDRI